MDEGRYRDAERALWEEAGALPSERRVRLRRLGVDIRVMEVGDGPPVVFLHGGPAAGSSWATLAARMTDFRCIVPDRPGTGLSDPLKLDAKTIGPFAETFAIDLLDALEVRAAHLIGSSTGGYMALVTGSAHSARVLRSVQLGCPDFVAGFHFPVTYKLMMVPGLRQLFMRMPASEKAFLSSLRQIGHGQTIDAGRISRAAIEWGISLQRDTDTFRHELESMAGTYSVRGVPSELALQPADLAQVGSPTLFVWGENDPFGSVKLGRRLAAAMPDAKLEVMAAAGHLPWVDDADHVADMARRHLLGQAGD